MTADNSVLQSGLTERQEVLLRNGVPDISLTLRKVYRQNTSRKKTPIFQSSLQKLGCPFQPPPSPSACHPICAKIDHDGMT